MRVETDRETGRRWSASPRATAAQTTLEATLGNINTPSVWIDPNNGQSYYVVTYYDGARGRRPERARRRCRCASATHGEAVTLGAYGNDPPRRSGPIAVERNQLQRAAHVLMQTEGRDIGSAAAELEQKLRSDPRTQRTSTFDFVGQVELMRDDVLGPRRGASGSRSWSCS